MSPDGGAAEDGELFQTCRLDKWLWFARVVKSRTTAAGLIENGKTRLNRSKVLKPSQGVRAGDVLTVAIGPRVRVLKILALGVRRGPAQEARLLYEDLMPVTAGRVLDGAPPEAIARPPGSGRPTKRDRRQMLRLKSQ
jgi:ribosome-associated heat shock protein Hsp15